MPEHMAEQDGIVSDWDAQRVSYVSRPLADSEEDGCPSGWHGPWRETADGLACVDCGAPKSDGTDAAGGEA